jgi:putative spermidine/putrescine transport system permease protein
MVGPIAFMLGASIPTSSRRRAIWAPASGASSAPIIFPLSLPGVVVGAIFVSVMVLGEFATSAALSGRKVNLLGNIIVTQVGSLKWALRVGRRRHPDGDHGRRDRRAAAHRRSEEGALRAMESRSHQARAGRLHGLFLVFLYGPFGSGILSFQTGPEGGPQFPIIEWSTYWYQHIFGLTPPSRVAPLPIGNAVPLARARGHDHDRLDRARRHVGAGVPLIFRGSGVVFYLIVLGMMVPGILVGLGIGAGREPPWHRRHWWSTAFVTACRLHLPLCLPRDAGDLQPLRPPRRGGVLVARRRPIRTFRKMTFPLIFPGVLSAMLFAFTLSYDEFSRTLVHFRPRAPCRWRSTAPSRSRFIRTSSPSACSPRCFRSRCSRLRHPDDAVGPPGQAHRDPGGAR